MSAPNQSRSARSDPAFPRQWAVAVLIILGLALIAAPFAFNMFARAPKGAVMISGFRPFMTSARLDGYQAELRQINAGTRQANTAVAAYLYGTGPGASQEFQHDFPTFVAFNQQWRQIDGTMTSLLTTVQDNRDNYLAVAALPPFWLFPWFFAIPGVLIAGLGVLSWVRPRSWAFDRWALVVIGIGLVLAPVGFQMFNRAPKGGTMMTAFKSLETTPRIETIQGYFGTISVGQGAVRLQMVPALEAKGLTAAQVDTRFPAVATLDRNWVHILGDLTPMIGAMSDNIPNYQAVASLPPFPLFPWFFVIPGVLTAVLALVAGRRPDQEHLESEPPSSNMYPTIEGAS
jgi:hypothetical protein